MRTAKSMSKFFYNIAAKIACFLINYKIHVTRDTEKQTLLLAGSKHTTIVDFERKFFLKTERENLFVNDQWKLSRNEGKRVLKFHLR